MSHINKFTSLNEVKVFIGDSGPSLPYFLSYFDCETRLLTWRESSCIGDGN